MGNFNRDRGGRGGFGDHGEKGGFRAGRRRGFGGGHGGDREMFSATCSNCGKECRVPFRPTNGKPVYCSVCFEKMGGGKKSKRPGRSEFEPRSQGNDQNKAQLDAINAKLERILNILAPESPVPVAVEEKTTEEVTPKTVKEAKPKKVKKSSK
jgi:DNA-directed RNA polymerase